MQLYAQVAAHLCAAWLAGGLIGLERSYHGRAAGFRTHCLVAIASAAAVAVGLGPEAHPGAVSADAVLQASSRLAQGVMTGIGFLGAGVIFRAGVNIQGLTTAASVWATAAIGLLFGVGLYAPATLATAAVLASLILLRWAELWMPSQVYAWSTLRFRAGEAPSGEELMALITAAGASLAELSFARRNDGAILEYSGALRMGDPEALRILAETLRNIDGLVEYELQRISK